MVYSQTIGRFSATLGLLGAERSSYANNGVDVKSRDVANAPNFTYSARLDYESDRWPLCVALK